MSLHAIGTVVFVASEKGFGFLRPGDESKDIFFHANDLEGGLEFGPQLQEARVCFEIVQSSKGPRAKKIRLAS